jgi:hypothetical protein
MLVPTSLPCIYVFDLFSVNPLNQLSSLLLTLLLQLLFWRSKKHKLIKRSSEADLSHLRPCFLQMCRINLEAACISRTLQWFLNVKAAGCTVTNCPLACSSPPKLCSQMSSSAFLSMRIVSDLSQGAVAGIDV